MRIQNIIARKRDGGVLSDEEIRWFVDGYMREEIPDYQAAALLMAIYLRGMDAGETAALTAAMADSGAHIDLSGLSGPTLDKHSTGGVGDKTSLVVVPVLAAAGVRVCKMSGRGLGHTGGTLDKLESIPGFRVSLNPDEMRRQVESVGACLAGQTADLAPADKRLYALRDAIAAVESLPLIVSSILSKKLAAGAGAFLFDVKVGSGALMRREEDARALARALVDGARQHGRRAVALLTDMDQPLGTTVGNSLEVREAIETLTPGHAGTDARWHELCTRLSTEGLMLAGVSEAEATQTVRRLLEDGGALRKFREIVAAQGGDVRVVDDPSLLPTAPVLRDVSSTETGFVSEVDTAALGNVVVELGGGRRTKEDRIDPSVGLTILRRRGERVLSGESIARIHAATAQDADAAEERVRRAFTLSDGAVTEAPVVRGRIGGGD